MEKLKVVTEIESRMDRILSERQEALAQLDGQMAEADAAVAAANDAMDKATAAGDLQAYQAAKAERTSAADGREMYEARKAALLSKPLIPDSEYKKACADIRAELAALDGKVKRELTALSDQMSAIADDMHDCIGKANAVMHKLQHEVYHDADRSRHPKTGEIIPLSHEEARVNPEFNSTVEWGRAGVSTGAYQRYTGRKG